MTEAPADGPARSRGSPSGPAPTAAACRRRAAPAGTPPSRRRADARRTVRKASAAAVAGVASSPAKAGASPRSRRALTRAWAPAFAGAQRSAGPERAETAPPATRDKPLATQLTTFLFYFCSLSRELTGRSQWRNSAPSISLRNRTISRTAARVPRRETPKPMWTRADLDRLVALVQLAARCFGGNNPVAARPDRQGRHRRLGGGISDRRPVDRVSGDPLIELPDVVEARVARERRAERRHRAHPLRHCARQLAGEELRQGSSRRAAPGDRRRRGRAND